MKRIMLGTVMFMKTEKSVGELLKGWLETAGDGGQGGISFATQRSRLKVMDKLEEAVDTSAEYVDLEGDEYTTLKVALDNTKLAIVDRGLVEAQERVLEAKAPPKPEDKPKPN